MVVSFFNLMDCISYLDGRMERFLIKVITCFERSSNWEAHNHLFVHGLGNEHAISFSVFVLVTDCTRVDLFCIFSFNCTAATAHAVFVLHVTVGVLFWLHLFHCDWNSTHGVCTHSPSVTVHILYWHFNKAFESTPSSISFKVYWSPKFACVSFCCFL